MSELWLNHINVIEYRQRWRFYIFVCCDCWLCV